MTLKLLDLFSGAGGAARGYQLAGFEVTGVDLVAQPRYAGDHFVQADALEYLAGSTGFDAIHASPPCRDHSPLSGPIGKKGTGHLLADTRAMLAAQPLPYVIENVEGADMPGSIVLCGTEFGLRSGAKWLKRHRRFESNVFLMGAGGCSCPGRSRPVGVYGDLAKNDRPVRHSQRGDVIVRAGVQTARDLLGCPWMEARELSQAIPPMYTFFVGEQLATHIRTSTANRYEEMS